MAFEVFDDVAFYFVAVIILSMFLLPPTFVLLWKWFRGSKSPAAATDGQECTCPGCTKKRKALEQEKVKEPRFSTPKILFILGWVLLLYLLWQMPEMKGQDLATFNPYEVIGVDKDASDEDVKRAYRKMAVKLHPDKNRDDPDADKKFILLTKAYSMLTDETAKANMEKYGNPDGYKGVSVTIGLPSFLTKKQNELPILILYFLVFILLPPTLIFFWWRSISQVHDSGLLHDTLPIYWRYITENMSVKFLIEVLAASVEFKWLEEKPTDPADMRKVIQDVKDVMLRQKFSRPYIVKASHLLHAHMLRVEIPASLQEDLRGMLKDVPKLLDVMLEMTSSRRFLRPALSVMELQQCITQALWVHDSPLLQLPHLTDKEVRLLAKKGVNSLAKFRQAEMDKKQKLLPHLTEQQWREIEWVLQRIPAVEMLHKYEVEDEIGVCEGDIVTLTVTLNRLSGEKATMLADSQASSVSLGGDDDEEEEDGGKKKKGKAAGGKRGAGKEESEAAPSPSSSDSGAGLGIESPKETKVPSSSASSSSSDSASPRASGHGSGDEKDKKALWLQRTTEQSEDELLDELIKGHKKDKEPDATAPFVHAPYFPYDKREVWYVSLIEIPRNRAPTLIQTRKVVDLKDTAQIQFKLQAPSKGEVVFEIHAKCDSYMGCDQVSKCVMKVDKAKGEGRIWELEAKAEEDEDKPDADEVDEDALEKKEEPGKWYYLGCSSLQELAVNAAVLVILGGVILGTLHERGILQKYVYPLVSMVGVWLRPVWTRVGPFVQPYLQPLEGSFAWLTAQLSTEDAASSSSSSSSAAAGAKGKKRRRKDKGQDKAGSSDGNSDFASAAAAAESDDLDGELGAKKSGGKKRRSRVPASEL